MTNVNKSDLRFLVLWLSLVLGALLGGVLGGMLFGGCAQSRNVREQAQISQQHQESLRVNHEARCREIFEEADIEDMREWCTSLSVTLRASSREHACQLVREYELQCADVLNR